MNVTAMMVRGGGVKAVYISESERPFRRTTRPEPERLYGTESAEKFLRRHLLAPPRKHAHVPIQNSLLLYGRKGAGKSTLLHKTVNGKRVFIDGSGGNFASGFDEVVGWKLRPWDRLDQFESFISETIDRASRIHETYAVRHHSQDDPAVLADQVPKRMLIVIWNLHHLVSTRDETAMFQVSRLLSSLRIQATNVTHAGGDGAVKIVMTSDVPPGQLSAHVRSMIDAEQYVGNMDAHERRGFLLEHMRGFQSVAVSDPDFAKLGWAVDLSEDAIQSDPDHIVNQLTIASNGCTPWEMKCFLDRVNLACAQPKEDGGTEYSTDLISSLLCKTTGVGTTLTDHNPATLNMPFARYLGTAFTTPDEFDMIANTKRTAADAALDAPFLSPEEREKKKRSLEERDAEMSDSLAALAARAEADANAAARKKHREDAFSKSFK